MTHNPDAIDSRFTIYTMGDSNYFVGIIALINSVFLTMDDSEVAVVVLDLGLSPRQRDLIGRHCRVMDRTAELQGHPWYLTPYAYFDEPDGTIAIIDSDIIVTRSLTNILQTAESGSICVYPDPDSTRWFDSWEEVFSLRAPLRPKAPYMNAGFVALSTEAQPEFLRRWWDLCQLIAQRDQVGTTPEPALKYAGQDALNALLLSEISPDATNLLPTGSVRYSADQMAEIQVQDLHTLACVANGHPVDILHSIGAPKAWQRAAWRSVRPTGFLRLLRRVLLGDDVRIRLGNDDLVPWLRAGTVGRVALTYFYGVNFATRCIRSARYQTGRAARRVRRAPEPA